MNRTQIEEFGRLLVQHVRDAAIQDCDKLLQESARSPVAKRWREATDKQSAMIPDCVDETVFCLLRAIDQGLIQLSFRSESGETVDLYSEGLGELGGWFAGRDGWRSDYSSQRIPNDFADLA
jgi:hypothetical protein